MNSSEFSSQANKQLIVNICRDIASNYPEDNEVNTNFGNIVENIFNNILNNKFKFTSTLEMNKTLLKEFNTHVKQKESNTTPTFLSHQQLPEQRSLYRPKEEIAQSITMDMNKMKEEFDSISNPLRPPDIDFSDKQDNSKSIDDPLENEINKRNLDYNSIANSIPAPTSTPTNTPTNTPNVPIVNSNKGIKIFHDTNINLVKADKRVNFVDDNSNILRKLKTLPPISNENDNTTNNNTINNNSNSNVEDNSNNEILNSIFEMIKEMKVEISTIKDQLESLTSFNITSEIDQSS